MPKPSERRSTPSMAPVTSSFQQAYEQVLLYAPHVLWMLAVVAVGYVIARVVAKVFNKLGEKLGLQTAAERSGLADSMRTGMAQRAGHRRHPGLLALDGRLHHGRLQDSRTADAL